MPFGGGGGGGGAYLRIPSVELKTELIVVVGMSFSRDMSFWGLLYAIFIYLVCVYCCFCCPPF